MELLCWTLTLVLMAIGLIGTVLSAIPGTALIFGAAVLHRVLLGPGKSVGWFTLLVLALLLALSVLVDFAGGWLGAKRFGASRWGMTGAFLGALVGIFFGFIGLLIGPIVGALAGELLAGRKLVEAGRASWGALLGNLAASLGKLVIGLVMVSWFLIAAPKPF